MISTSTIAIKCDDDDENSGDAYLGPEEDNAEGDVIERMEVDVWGLN